RGRASVRASVLYVFPGAFFAVVFAPVVARGEGRAGLDLVPDAVLLRALHFAVPRQGVARLIRGCHGRLPSWLGGSLLVYSPDTAERAWSRHRRIERALRVRRSRGEWSRGR